MEPGRWFSTYFALLVHLEKIKTIIKNSPKIQNMYYKNIVTEILENMITLQSKKKAFKKSTRGAHKLTNIVALIARHKRI